MKEVAALVRRQPEGIVAWTQTRQTNGFLEAIDGLFQAAKRRARDFVRISPLLKLKRSSGRPPDA